MKKKNVELEQQTKQSRHIVPNNGLAKRETSSIDTTMAEVAMLLLLGGRG